MSCRARYRAAGEASSPLFGGEVVVLWVLGRERDAVGVDGLVEGVMMLERGEERCLPFSAASSDCREPSCMVLEEVAWASIVGLYGRGVSYL